MYTYRSQAEMGSLPVLKNTHCKTNLCTPTVVMRIYVCVYIHLFVCLEHIFIHTHVDWMRWREVYASVEIHRGHSECKLGSIYEFWCICTSWKKGSIKIFLGVYVHVCMYLRLRVCVVVYSDNSQAVATLWHDGIMYMCMSVCMYVCM